jgi:transposase
VRTEALEYVDGGKRITKRFAHYVYSLCKILTVKEVADHLGLDRKTVKDIDKSFLEEEFGVTDYTGLRILAIDEIAVKRGHRYLTVVLDYETGRVVWVGRDRDKETLTPFFQGMTEAQRAQIQAVALDMWDPYINCLRRWCPAAKIVFDLFHVVKEFNKAIDAVRNREYRTASEADRCVLKGSKYLLLKNGKNLRPDEVPKLEKLLNLNRNLATMYILKDSLKELWACSSRSQALVALSEWRRIAEESAIPEARSFAKRLRNYCYGILNHAEYSISSGRLEGTNNKIKVIKRRSYGFHDIDYFILKIKQAFPGKINQLFRT